MLALYKVDAVEGGVALRQAEPRAPDAGEILIKVAAAGICGTDMQIYNWAPRMARRMTLPLIMGHELSGTIAALGPGVGGLGVGDRISLESHIFCDACRQCRIGNRHLCTNTRYPGIDIDGGFAEYVTVPARIAWVNPPHVEHHIAAMLEPFGIAVHACLAGSGVSGRTVLVNGCGPIGLMTVAAARALGARLIVACDVNRRRLDVASVLGADRVVDAGAEDLGAAVRDVTAGEGVDVGIEYSGSEAGFKAVFDAIAKGGDFRLVGAPAAPIAVDFTYWLLKCPTMHNIHGRRIWQSWQRATDLVYNGAVDLKPLASHVLPLKDGLKGFDLVRKGEAIKPLLIPGG